MCGRDDWDPNVLFAPRDYEYRIYHDWTLERYAIIDEEDYSWAARWLWNPIWWNRKQYLRRASSVWSGGKRLRVVTYYLHIEIMKRTGIEPPSPNHVLVDHRDGDTMNCRRSNLRWVTDAQNRKNYKGRYRHGFDGR